MEEAVSLCITCNDAQPRSVLSNVTTTVLAVITAMTFSASGLAVAAYVYGTAVIVMALASMIAAESTRI